MLYCSDFWAVLVTTKNPVEFIHMKFIKQLLGVQTKTPNVGVLLETGRVPLMSFATKNCIKNWNRIANERKCSPLTHASYLNIVEKDLDWYKKMTQILNQMGLGYILQREVKFPEKVVFQRSIDIFHQNAFANIMDEIGKLRTYKLVKSEIGCESYLKTIINEKDRISLTKFRLSNHKLMIEKGRHFDTEKKIGYAPSVLL